MDVCLRPQVNQSTEFSELVDREPWLKTTQLVVKPDMLFGKRGKNDLLALNVNIGEAEAFIAARMNKQVPGMDPVCICWRSMIAGAAVFPE